MACIYRSAPLKASAAAAWKVLDRYTRSEVLVFPSMCSAVRQEGDYRIVTTPAGVEVPELNISVNPELRRAAYTIPGVPGAEHHHAVMEITEDGAGKATLVWVTDVRPDEIAVQMAPMYDVLFAELTAAVEAG